MHHTARYTTALVLTGDPDQAKIAASTLGRMRGLVVFLGGVLDFLPTPGTCCWRSGGCRAQLNQYGSFGRGRARLGKSGRKAERGGGWWEEVGGNGRRNVSAAGENRLKKDN